MEINLEYIRQLYLQQLSAELSPVEQAVLSEAIQHPHIDRLCAELNELYHSPEMKKLLRERPTEKRWRELKKRAEKSTEPHDDLIFPPMKNFIACSLLLIMMMYILWKLV
ncbi:hypothetical protein [uncultured Chitinophaga sp.]|uniref:hypothetical protein n=1 Tax=uncultured Chitinophaga sp. TaxID=339340 RepID=UPI0026152241|nr:hypothetical protein [uncultured Chitinophaga sp.]